MRVKTTGHRHVHSPEEIELLIAESRDGGLLEPQEQVRLHQALRLGLRTARQLMVPRRGSPSIDVATPFPKSSRSSPRARTAGFRSIAARRRHHRHPPHEGRRHGLHRRPPARLAHVAPATDRARARTGMPADHLLTYLRERRSHQALVVDDGGQVEG